MFCREVQHTVDDKHKNSGMCSTVYCVQKPIFDYCKMRLLGIFAQLTDLTELLQSTFKSIFLLKQHTVQRVHMILAALCTGTEYGYPK